MHEASFRHSRWSDNYWRISFPLSLFYLGVVCHEIAAQNFDENKNSAAAASAAAASAAATAATARQDI